MRMRSVLEILLLQALAFQAQGNQRQALNTLQRALLLAEPEGYIRLFIDEEAPMAALLRQAYTHKIAPTYIATLLQAGSEPLATGFPLQRSSPLIEPLTEREREVRSC